MMIQANGGNASEYCRAVGLPRSSCAKMLSGEVRVTDRALGIEVKQNEL